jgi:calcium-dependent protein kinase
LAGVVQRAASRIGTVSVKGRYHKLPRRLKDDYIVNLNEVAGSGANGKVYIALRITKHWGLKEESFPAKKKMKSTMEFAVKSLKFPNLRDKYLLALLRNEAEVFLSLDHPNVVRLVDVYESEQQLDLVMEHMQGGELFSRIAEKKTFSEAEAADAALQMLRAINYMHSHGLAYRDLKLENFMCEKKNSSVIKLIDFGFSKAFDGQCCNMHEKLGTASYVAPEVLRGSYTSQCDLWSLGVIVFILLAGYMPFKAHDQHKIMEGILVWKPDCWSNVSEGAVDFVTGLLALDPNKRSTAAKALDHPWLSKQLAYQEHEQRKQFDKSVAKALVSFSEKSLQWRLFMGLMPWSLAPSEHANVRDVFHLFDRTNSGVVKQDNFIQVLVGFGVPERDCRLAFDALDVNKNKQLDYSEFLAGMMTSRLQIDNELLCRTFRRFDLDGDGYIAQNELNQFTCDHRQIMNEVDANSDGRISCDEFIQAVRSEIVEIERPRRFMWLRDAFLGRFMRTTVE